MTTFALSATEGRRLGRTSIRAALVAGGLALALLAALAAGLGRTPASLVAPMPVPGSGVEETVVTNGMPVPGSTVDESIVSNSMPVPGSGVEETVVTNGMPVPGSTVDETVVEPLGDLVAE